MTADPNRDGSVQTGGRSSASSFAGGTDGTGAHGSLGERSPSWWEPEDGSEPEPWVSAEGAYERFADWIDERGIEL